MELEILSIGSELLDGHTVDTNAPFLSRELTRRGYTVFRYTVLPEDPKAIEEGIKEAMKRGSLAIVTGKDLAIARKLLKNGDPLILLPSEPREMERMFFKEALPEILERYPVSHPFFHRSCSLCLLRELEVEPFLRELKVKHPTLHIGMYPSLASLQIEFSGKEPQLLEQAIRAVEKQFPTFYFSSSNISEAVHKEFIARKKTLALAESCTGGAMAARLTAIPDASLYFLGSLVVYTNSWKEHFLQVSRSTLQHSGAVSVKTVEEMVIGLFHETKTDYAIAVSGIAGPGGGTPQKPVGTVCIAIGERGGKIDTGILQGPADRVSAIEWTVQTSLGALWRRLVHQTHTFS